MRSPKVLAAVIVIALALALPVAGATQLEPLVQAATGIQRVVAPDLQQRAATRAIAIQTDFAHCCLALGEAEIIAWNSGYADPVGQLVIGWLGSPEHAAIMLNPGYTEIGCGTSYLAPRTYGVCLFRWRAQAPSGAPVPRPVVPLSNTDMARSAPETDALLLALALMAAAGIWIATRKRPRPQ